jgi:transcriptional regulator with XRE-family HTH domain
MKHGNRIAELRESRGWTQEQLSGMIGITRAALSHYEKNRRKPDYDTLTTLADLFNVTIDYLIGRTHQKHTPLDQEVQQFVDQLELSDEDLLARFSLTIDGRQLTDEEAKRFIAFVRAERMLNSKP